MEKWLSLITQAPDYIKSILLPLFWMIVLLVFLWTISLLLRGIIHSCIKISPYIIKLTTAISGGMRKNFSEFDKASELPFPYPKIKRVIKILSMIHTYSLSLSVMFISALVCFMALYATFVSKPPFYMSMLTAGICVFFAKISIYFLAEAQRARIALFPKLQKVNQPDSGSAHDKE